MNSLTREQQLANIDLAERLWRERVKPEQIVPRLVYWGNNCGTVACFGGHVATWPEFNEQGVWPAGHFFVYLYGAGAWKPMLAPDTGVWGGLGIAGYLFGDSDLFIWRGRHPADPMFDAWAVPDVAVEGDDLTVTDHQLVLNRLAYAREALRSAG